MNKLYDFELVEFDWFSKELLEAKEPEDYENIVDLKVSGAAEALDTEAFEDIEGADEVHAMGDIEADGLAWEYHENLQKAMNSVFESVYEKLCGGELGASSELITDYVDYLNKKCVVIQSQIRRENMEENVHGDFDREPIARIKNCFMENGCAVSAVSDAQWRELMGEPEGAFVDSGLRILQIIGIQGKQIIVNDCASRQGRAVAVSEEDFCRLYGILMEVYK